MASNFTFIEQKWPMLATLGKTAEKYLHTDPASCIGKLGLLAERLVLNIFNAEGLKEDTDTPSHGSRLWMLKNLRILPYEIYQAFNELRKARNTAVHDGTASPEDAQYFLPITFRLTLWTLGVYAGLEPPFPAYVKPEPDPDYRTIVAQQEALITELEKQKADALLQAEMTAKQLSEWQAKRSERITQATDIANELPLTEAETRYLIDRQLKEAGWEADTQNLRYAKGTRPVKGRNLAIAEWPTGSTSGRKGFADYALFIGEKLVGIVEAKRKNRNIASVLDNQCKDYAAHIREEDARYTVGQWQNYRVPFIFSTNGRPYLKQLETESGIWFQDLRRSNALPHALPDWHNPQGLSALLAQDIDLAESNLRKEPYDLLTDPQGLNLWDYQLAAIQAAEDAILSGKQTALIAMATGTGKTRTVLGLIYRMLKTKRFRRILFLVDRTALGDQALGAFKQVKLENLLPLASIYTIGELRNRSIELETRVQVATVQSMVTRIFGSDTDDSTAPKDRPNVSDYDLIVIDEAHRGYNLDREMSENEMRYREQEDYISQYRAVIEYFDAVKVALTATPALHTTQIFGHPVYSYSYRQAVIDGCLVDHDVPLKSNSELRESGITYRTGEQLALFDPVTHEITNSADLPDDVHFEVEQFNRQIITESFTRTHLEQIAVNLSFDGPGKTLVYAVNDRHADQITQILKETAVGQGCDANAVMKITGSIDRVDEAIRLFKNETYPTIVVTVDLLTTGIDVPAIDTLVFMRRVRSRILFEQMLGRATRLCPEINKEHFTIYDCVGVYEALQEVSTMKPVVQQVSSTFEQLVQGISTAATPEETQNQVNLVIAKLQRKRFRNPPENAKAFADATGMDFDENAPGDTIRQYISHLKKQSPEQAAAILQADAEALKILDRTAPSRPMPIVIDTSHPDTATGITTVYPKGAGAEDYLEAFNTFITDNKNKVKALQIVCSRPSELTRDTLKELAALLTKAEFNVEWLRSAWRESKNEDIAADIIAFIRRSALGSPLISHEERVRRAFRRIRSSHTFNRNQQDWLNRFEKTMTGNTDALIDHQMLDSGAYRLQGGFNKINQRFEGKLDALMAEINTYLYDDKDAA